MPYKFKLFILEMIVWNNVCSLRIIIIITSKNMHLLGTNSQILIY